MIKVRSDLGRSLLAGVLLWASFPPIHWWPLAIVSLAIMIAWIDQESPLGRRGYLAIWLGASLTWLALLQGIRLAYWPLHAGWIALSLYLAVYTVVFIGMSRCLVHRWRFPLAVAAPMAWISIELARGYIITGFSGCLLGHCVVELPQLIQIASHLGAYGVSGCVVLTAVLVYWLFDRGRWLRFGSTQSDELPGASLLYVNRQQCFASLLVLVAVAIYGFWEVDRTGRLAESRTPLFSAALIQQNAPTIFDTDPDRNFERSQRAWESYLAQTKTTVETTEALDLVIWPESMFTRHEPIFDWDGQRTLPPALIEDGVDVSQLETIVERFQNALDVKLARVFETFDSSGKDRPHLLLGNDAIRIHGTRYHHFNAALWISPQGKLLDYYAKQHLVMFGEYIPFAEYFPGLFRVFPLPRVSPGETAKRFDLDGKASIAPSICFENVLPHVLHQKLQSISMAEPTLPEVMINITNDGWFRGSSISDHHLANATFASVENRRPMLVAANTGLSAWIDGGGNRIAVLPRLEAGTIVARPTPDGRWGLWQSIGDWPARLVAFICFGLWLGSRWKR